MIFCDQEARRRAREEIDRLNVLLANVPGNVISLQDVHSLHFYLNTLSNEIYHEYKEALRFKITYTFLNPIGEYSTDTLDNNGAGYTDREARDIRRQMRQSDACTIKSIEISPLTPLAE